jgi:hypothetical protein
MSSPPAAGSPALQALCLHLAGWLLFLFIPLVLFLYVRHPRPLWASLAAGVLLMSGHRFLARPFMHRVRPVRCVWCSRWLADGGAPASEAVVETRGGPLALLTCARHEQPTRRFFTLLDRLRLPLALAIFLPLLALLLSLAWAAFDPAPADLARLATATAVFQLAVGLAVNAAAWGYLAAPPAGRLRVAFPLHNFYLLGIRTLLWVFRIVGILWIFQGLRALTR